MVNTQHDCHHAQCSSTQEESVRQERELSAKTRLTVRHNHPEDDRYLLNTRSIHNYAEIAAAVPDDLRARKLVVGDPLKVRLAAAKYLRATKKGSDSHTKDIAGTRNKVAEENELGTNAEDNGDKGNGDLGARGQGDQQMEVDTAEEVAQGRSEVEEPRLDSIPVFDRKRHAGGRGVTKGKRQEPVKVKSKVTERITKAAKGKAAILNSVQRSVSRVTHLIDEPHLLSPSPGSFPPSSLPPPSLPPPSSPLFPPSPFAPLPPPSTLHHTRRPTTAHYTPQAEGSTSRHRFERHLFPPAHMSVPSPMEQYPPPALHGRWVYPSLVPLSPPPEATSYRGLGSTFPTGSNGDPCAASSSDSHTTASHLYNYSPS